MKRYLAFYGYAYHPLGGMDDLIGDYDTIDEALKGIRSAHKENHPVKDSEELKNKFKEWYWAHIYDIQKNVKVKALVY